MKTATMTLAILFCGLSLSVPTSSRAEKYTVSMGAGQSHLPSTSVDALTAEQGFPSFELQGGRELLPLPGIGDLEVGMSLSMGSVSGTSFERIESSLSMQSVMLYGRVRRQLVPRLSYFGQLDLGAQWGTLQIDDAASNAGSLEARDSAAASRLGTGLDMRLSSSGRDVQLGVRWSLAYRLMAPLAFAATPMEEDSETLRISTSSAELGSVNTSGLAMALSFYGQF